MTLESNLKKLSELRVVDLRTELERRKLDCSGVKAVLLKKLEKALKDEGEDPDTYKFCLSPSSNRTKGNSVGPNENIEVNGDDKSDDEKPVSDDEMMKKDGDDYEDNILNEPSDDETMKQDCDDMPSVNQPSHELKKDEKSDDERPTSDDESRQQNCEEIAVNDLSDDEQQAAEARDEIINEKQTNYEDPKASDDENPTPEEKKRNEDIKKELQGSKDEDEEPQLSDDQLEDSEEKKEFYQERMDHSESADDSNQSNHFNGTIKATNYDQESASKKDVVEGVCNDPLSNGIEEERKKKLRPRITAPTDDGNSTKTPVLKKDITLPPAKPKDEEFIVPEKEADIYDKEKFIVKDDTTGDSEDTVMDFEEDINNMDNEDSINLTIGEDDAKFMTEEAGLDNEDKDALELRRADKKKGPYLQLDGDKQQTSSEAEDASKAKSLWVSGLSSATRATDLKHLFTKHGKVIAAKIVTNAKTPGARCYGFVTMATYDDANSCIKALNLTELHGRLISVEPVADKPAKKMEEHKRSPNRIDKEKDRASMKSDSVKRDHDGDLKRNDKNRARDYDRRRLSRERDRERRDHHGRHDVLSFEQIKEERKKQKMVAMVREMREQDRRKREEMLRQRDIERRNREEALRLEREREKLKYERERIERERAELLILERARLERDKEELKRQKMRLEEDRKLKRTLNEREEYGRGKRPTPDYGRHYGGHQRSPNRHFDRFNDRGLGQKRDDRKEHRRSRSPRRRSRERNSNAKGYKYPEPVYGNGKAGYSGSGGWSHGEPRSKSDGTWSRSAPPPPPTSDRWPTQVGGSLSGSGSRGNNIYPSSSSSIPPNISLNSPLNHYPERFDAYKNPINRKY